MSGVPPHRSDAAVGHAPLIVVFDTDCVLCGGMVAFVLRHERAPEARFVGAWSAEGLSLAARHGLTRDDLGRTFLVVSGGRGLVRSDAGIAILSRLRAPWSWLVALRIVPRAVRDPGYDLLARHRYRIFGRREACVVIPPGQAWRFGDLGGRSGPPRP